MTRDVTESVSVAKPEVATVGNSPLHCPVVVLNPSKTALLFIIVVVVDVVLVVVVVVVAVVVVVVVVVGCCRLLDVDVADVVVVAIVEWPSGTDAVEDADLCMRAVCIATPRLFLNTLPHNLHVLCLRVCEIAEAFVLVDSAHCC